MSADHASAMTHQKAGETAPASLTSVMPQREKLDPHWHRARVAARILLKARKRPLNARDKRLARLFSKDKGVTNRLVEQGIAYWLAPYRTGHSGEKLPRVCHVLV